MNPIKITLTLPDTVAGLRLDQAIAKVLPDYSRTEIRSWIDSGELTVNDNPPRASAKARGGEIIRIEAMPRQQTVFAAEAIPLDIVHEDEAIIVINKPAGLVVHPAAGNYNNTMLNALLHHAPELAGLPRAGIIHRLDRDTTGLLVVARTMPALKALSAQMRKRSITRIYETIVSGVLISGGTIDAPVGRHPVKRVQMSIRAVEDGGRPAITHYRIIEKYRNHTRIRVQLETGRTHQIRVHMAYKRHPVVGDPIYSGRLQLPESATPALVTVLRQFHRQALHATMLGLIHPVTQAPVSWTSPLPADMLSLIEILKEDLKIHHERR